MRMRARAAGLLCLLGGEAVATPEGTPQLGLTQGLEDISIVRVEVRAGESVRVCSSDDGLQEAPVEGAAIDRMAGAPNPVAEARRGSEILVWAPDTTRCASDAECAGETRCFVQNTGAAWSGPEQSGLCAQVLSVNGQGGPCAAGTPCSAVCAATAGLGRRLLPLGASLQRAKGAKGAKRNEASCNRGRGEKRVEGASRG